MRNFIPADAKLIPANATRVFQGVIFDVYHWEQELFDGSTQTFEMLKRPDSVATIAVKDGTIIVQNEEQSGVGSFYAFPGGRHDVESESELQAAQRELLEETGMTFSNWKLIAAVQPHIKIDWLIYTFVATGFIGQKEQELDAGERVMIMPKTFEEVRELSRDPANRYLEKDLFNKMQSLEELMALPDISA